MLGAVNDAATSPIEFRCNLCGTANRAALAALDRELPTCTSCRSNVRWRAIGRLVTREVLGLDAVLTELSSNKRIRGVGLSDARAYAKPLARKFAYRNTYLHRWPRLDITAPSFDRYGDVDFIIASDVFEHVPPPVSRAFENAYRLLRPGGVLLFTVPFSLDADTLEHFPELHEWTLTGRDGARVLVNRSVDGRVSRHEGLVFHGGGGTTLEMRVFSQAGLLRELEQAGFSRVRVCGEPYLPFGIHWPNPWSLPIAAHR